MTIKDSQLISADRPDNNISVETYTNVVNTSDYKHVIHISADIENSMDWDGDSRPDYTLNNRVIKPGESITEREQPYFMKGTYTLKFYYQSFEDYEFRLILSQNMVFKDNYLVKGYIHSYKTGTDIKKIFYIARYVIRGIRGSGYGQGMLRIELGNIFRCEF